MRDGRILRLIIIAPLVLSFAIAAALQAPQEVRASEKVNVSAICSDFDDFGLTHGGCVALGQSHDQRSSADLSAICKDIIIGTDVFDNQGQCVTTLWSYYN